MRKAAVLLLVFTVIISAALITIQRKIDGENCFAVIKESMGEYEYGEDMLGIAVTRTLKSKSIIHNFGRPIYPADRELQYVWLYINVVNKGTTAVQVEPYEFTLSIPGGDVVDHDFRASNSMQKYFKTVILEPDKQNIGVLIFPMPENKEYVLHYNGPKGKVEKRIVIDSP